MTPAFPCHAGFSTPRAGGGPGAKGKSASWRLGWFRTIVLPILLAALIIPSGHAEPVPLDAMKHLTFVPNPEGLQAGFWANYKFSKEVLRDFGLRPLERVNFHKWAQFEKKPGEFQWNDCFRSEKLAHLAGSTVIGNVNVFFTRTLNPEGMDAIPEFHTRDIRDPATRKAARRFLVEFVTRSLDEIGQTRLLLDYEFLWFALPRTQEVRDAYRDWFVEAAALCRETATNLGKQHLLKIGCCLDSDPLSTAKHLIGSPALPIHEPQKWLQDVVRASDFLAVDTYAYDPADPASPKAFLNGLKFWIEQYAGDKPVFVTENGFSTAPAYGYSEKGYHARGTEAEQARFFENVFAAFQNRSAPEFRFLERIRGYCIWMYRDMNSMKDPLEDHFGILRRDGSPKPAFQVIKKGIEGIERSPSLSPVTLTQEKAISSEELSSHGIRLTYDAGAEHQALQISFQKAAGVSAVELSVETANPCCVMAHVEGAGWFSNHPRQNQKQTLRLAPLPDAKTQTVTLYFTSEKLPAETLVRRVELQPVSSQ
jgi:hypothetical protein